MVKKGSGDDMNIGDRIKREETTLSNNIQSFVENEKYIYRELGISQEHKVQTFMEQIHTAFDGKHENNHAVFLYLIGNIIYKSMGVNLDIHGQKERYPFLYLWFLICFAHGIGEGYERETGYWCSIPECWKTVYGYQTTDSIKDSRLLWYKNHGINISYLAPNRKKNHLYSSQITQCKQSHKQKCIILNKRICNLKCEHSILFSNEIMVEGMQMNQKEKEAYFQHNINQRNRLEHGIVGGDVLYSKLILNYFYNYKISWKNGERKDCFEGFYSGGVHFYCEQFKIYSYIANCLSAHTRCEEGEIADSMRSVKHQKISLQKDPLLFLLCITDVVEPTQYFKNMDAGELTSSIDITYNSASKRIEIFVLETLCQSQEGKKYIRRLEQIRNWCEIKVKIEILPVSGT